MDEVTLKAAGKLGCAAFPGAQGIPAVTRKSINNSCAGSFPPLSPDSQEDGLGPAPFSLPRSQESSGEPGEPRARAILVPAAGIPWKSRSLGRAGGAGAAPGLLRFPSPREQPRPGSAPARGSVHSPFPSSFPGRFERAGPGLISGPGSFSRRENGRAGGEREKFRAGVTAQPGLKSSGSL